jgi:deferrochelatase/peroxidase EfeB/lysophospholipase L1-like esterase
MRADIRGKTGSVAGTSDLTVAAPIKPGLVPALDAVTYKSRVKRVLRTLHHGRKAAHEEDFVRLLSDAVERVGRIHSVRIAVIEPEDLVLLAVTFDGAWESYVRTIWQKVARLLDLIFCNTDDYVCGGTHSYEDWARWLRRRQVESPFLYAPPGLSYEDTVYHRARHRAALRDGATAAERAALATPVASAEVIVDSLIHTGVDPMRLAPPPKLVPPDSVRLPLAFRQGLRALVGLHRLADWYPPGTAEHAGDGEVLLRAAVELLPEFHRQLRLYPSGIERGNERFRDALDWFRDGQDRLPPGRHVRMPPPVPTLARPESIQAGILEPLPDCAHGLLVLLAFGSAAAMEAFLTRVGEALSTRGSKLAADGVSVNLALTIDGLRCAGLAEHEIERLPEEFRQGMAARAGLLGDLRLNHPRRWRLPVRNWVDGIGATEVGEQDGRPRVELESVHALLHLRACDPRTAETEGEARMRLLSRATVLVGSDGTTPLSLQWMRRLRDPKAKQPNALVEHFGFGDGMSDPTVDGAQAGRQFANHVHVGEALVGYGNMADEVPWNEAIGPQSGTFEELLHNGSFLAVRKLRQDLGALDEALERASGDFGLPRETLLAKMMGRYPARHPQASEPLVPLPDPTRLNDFNYRADLQGLACPFHAHIRRANPREIVAGRLTVPLAAGARVPRIFRRSLSYGPPHDRDETDPDRLAASLAAERGLVFMAYNASLGEQFETVQRWLAGGNSAGGASSPSDPFLGVAEGGHERFFRFQHAQGEPVRMHLDGDADPYAEPRPLVRLEWGLYAFAPSKHAIALLAIRAGRAGQPVPWDIEGGRQAIERLRAVEAREGSDAARRAWKVALEDAESVADFSAASIWAAIRARQGGVLRTPYGVLVAGPDLVESELRDTQRCTSVAGYHARMVDAFGEIFLGMDDGADYARESVAGLDAVATIDEQATYNVARDCVGRKLEALVRRARELAVEDEDARRVAGWTPSEDLRWETTIDIRELVDELLAVFCEQWFGLGTQGRHFARGGFSWNWQPGDPPLYPGHFMAPSRWFFQPHPEPMVAQTGQGHGQALRGAMQAYLSAFGPTLQHPATVKVLGSAAAKTDAGYAARTIVGLIMGFVPTVDGVLRRVLAQWHVDGTLASLRALRGSATNQALDAAIDAAFTRAMQARTVPDLIWRTATAAHTLGAGLDAVDVQPQDIVVLGLGSSTQQAMAEGRPELAHAFGGDRSRQGAPVHACPAMQPALAMMKGFVTALVTSDLPLRAGPAAGLLSVAGIERLPGPPGPNELLADAGVIAKLQRRNHFLRGEGPMFAAAYARPVRVWAIGDSWLDDIALVYPDLITELIPHGYSVVNESLQHTKTGYHLADLAHPDFLAELRLQLRDAAQGIGSTPAPALVLLSGGGNDVVNPLDRPRDAPLFGMLRSGSTVDEVLDRNRLCTFLGTMRAHFEAILDVVCAETNAPVGIIAYDHPIPDGRKPIRGGPWLKRKFDEVGLPDLKLNTAVMRELIDELNRMVSDLASDQQQQRSRKVHALQLSGVLGRQHDYGTPGDDTQFEAYWNDELHPRTRGYKVLAAAMAAQLAALGIKPA